MADFFCSLVAVVRLRSPTKRQPKRQMDGCFFLLAERNVMEPKWKEKRKI